jgi:hypothetical protein
MANPVQFDNPKETVFNCMKRPDSIKISIVITPQTPTIPPPKSSAFRRFSPPRAPQSAGLFYLRDLRSILMPAAVIFALYIFPFYSNYSALE